MSPHTGAGGQGSTAPGIIAVSALSFAGNVSALQSVGLGGNDIHDTGAINLASAMKVNTKLRSLGLGGNQIGEYCCDRML